MLLAIESTCDETAAAVINRQRQVLSSVVASQDDLHIRFGGVVPEIASRAHVRRILPVIDAALREADCQIDDISVVAVATEPGLVGSLLVGLTAAKTLAFALDVPLITINHIDAHLFACQMASDVNVFPAVGLVVSGGHTHLYDCSDATTFRLIGGTIDDAAGEAFDKVARILHLPYPGGPSIQQCALSGDPQAYKLPRPMLKGDDLNFSFSGLKTAVLYAARGVPGPDQLSSTPADRVADLAASFQEAAIDVLVTKCERALRQTRHPTLCVGGGVAANQLLRDRLSESCTASGTKLVIAPMELCTDNAAMGAIAWEHLESGRIASLDVDVLPGLVRGSV